MPGSYLIDGERRIVFSRGWGVLTDDEILSHAKTLRADPRFDPGFRQLLDFLGVSEILVTSAGISTLARHNPFRRDSRRAVIVPTDEAFGLTRMFSLYTDADPSQFGIFRTTGPALEWIGLDPASVWPERAPDAIFGVP